MNLNCGMSGDRKEIPIHFKSKDDFRGRIAHLWMDQKKDETYVFSFENKETEDDFNALMKAFNVGNDDERRLF